MNTFEVELIKIDSEFPSPTGVNYYESFSLIQVYDQSGFRPQQGLTIMNLPCC